MTSSPRRALLRILPCLLCGILTIFPVLELDSERDIVCRRLRLHEYRWIDRCPSRRSFKGRHYSGEVILCIVALTPADRRIEFLLTAKRDAAAAKGLLIKAIEALGSAMPRVIKWTKPGCPAAVEELHIEGTLPAARSASPVQVPEQHCGAGSQNGKKRVWLVQRRCGRSDTLHRRTVRHRA